MMNLRHIAAVLVLCISALGASAQSASQILNSAIKRFDNAGGVTANYVVANDKGTTKGTIDMLGNKFRIMSDDLKCWYDGKTQWTYSSMSGEVSITIPTLEEMQMSNPYIALTTLKKSCKVYKAYTQVEGLYTLKLVPKDNDQIKQILVYIHKDSYIVSKVYFEMTDGSYLRTSISNFKAANLPKTTFDYDPKAVPEGTDVVDLR
ncbi:MAG: LolA-like putative outer membrane lipoprotein chaperone [Muribaculaceae bacterium]